MCCYIDEKYTKRKIEQLKQAGEKFIWGWKELSIYGSAIYGKYDYNAGINKLTSSQEEKLMQGYSYINPSGFHFWLTKPTDYRPGKIVRVKILVSDIIGLESPKTVLKHIVETEQQGVARKLQILKKDWKEANFFRYYQATNFKQEKFTQESELS